MSKKCLIKDLVIPAGTVFDDAPSRIDLSGEHTEAVICISKNVSMSLILDASEYSDEIRDLFIDLRF